MEDFVETLVARDERRKAELAKRGATAKEIVATHTVWRESLAAGAVMIVGIPLCLGVFLGLIYCLVQFVKWAWSN